MLSVRRLSYNHPHHSPIRQVRYETIRASRLDDLRYTEKRSDSGPCREYRVPVHHLPYLLRFEAARDAGFASVEFPWPADDLAEVRRAVAGADLGVALLNMFAGDLSSGERGFPNDPVRVSEWRGWFDQALNLATDLHCPAINVLAGNLIEGISRPQQYACLSKNLRWALGHARSREIALTLEVLNPIETPSYLFTRLDDAATLLNTFADRLFGSSSTRTNLRSRAKSPHYSGASVSSWGTSKSRITPDRISPVPARSISLDSSKVWHRPGIRGRSGASIDRLRPASGGCLRCRAHRTPNRRLTPRR